MYNMLYRFTSLKVSWEIKKLSSVGRAGGYGLIDTFHKLKSETAKGENQRVHLVFSPQGIAVRPCHGAESHSAFSSRAGLGAG